MGDGVAEGLGDGSGDDVGDGIGAGVFMAVAGIFVEVADTVVVAIAALGTGVGGIGAFPLHPMSQTTRTSMHRITVEADKKDRLLHIVSPFMLTNRGCARR